ncbi:ribonuclease domain-containing protein [Gordonia westfalica]|uniref:Guanyl-specific ribonuclease Sa n=1 Tax=Gordonia westfalica TaxID=158898 RepID=A0A1H2KG03_9ACTN|nr:ribonuclease domain-containing protein [Gordonia westfalica]SDU67245.1 Guanyl-specific ribonuclease Sa [Gordonia westfalica]
MPSRSRSTPTVAQRRRQAAITAAAFALIAVVFAVTWFINSGSDSGADESSAAGIVSSASSTERTSAAETTTPRSSARKTTASKSTAAATATVPARVTRTLALIDAGEWPEAARAPGTKGGIAFRNNERLLPAADANGRRITYREWDVNPKEPGRSRDAERIVTGSDGTAWYTADHYRSFILIRGPS